MFSSNSDESEKNGSDSDSEGLASEGGSAESGFQDDKKVKKHKKKHKHKKKKKKKKSKSKDKDKEKNKSDKKSEKESTTLSTESKTNAPSLVLGSGEITRTVYNKSALDSNRDHKDSRKRKSISESDKFLNDEHEKKARKCETSSQLDEKDRRRDRKKHKKSRSK